MRIVLLVGWLMLPVLAVAWHYGPGQEKLHLDDVASVLAQAERRVTDGDWAEAAELYEQALKMLPAERTKDVRRVRVELAKAQMNARKLPQAHEDLKNLVDEMQDDPAADPKVLAEARSTLANSQYYMTWLLRLEGQAKDLWEPEVEAARQTYRLLAEQAEAAGDAGAAKKNREDLEATIRLARMDLSELQGLPLPSQ